MNHSKTNEVPGVQVANLGKSGVSVGYYDTEEAAARAYDRAAIGLLGRDNGSIMTNFPMAHYDQALVRMTLWKWTHKKMKQRLPVVCSLASIESLSTLSLARPWWAIGLSQAR